MVKAKFNWYAYLSFLFVLLFLFGSILLLASPQLTFKSKLGFTSYAPIVGIIFLILTTFLFRALAKAIYLVRINTDTIYIKGVFKRKRISLSEIKSINLFSKEDFYWSAAATTLGIRIELENEQAFIIADPFYRNIDIVKKKLSESFKEKIRPYRVDKKERAILYQPEGDFEKIAGNPFTSWTGLLLIVVIVMFLKFFLDSIKTNHVSAFIFILPLTFFCLIIGYQFNYFLISNNRLIIKNHLLFWINRELELKDIAVTYFEYPNKSAQALRITTVDFKSRLYFAGSLKDKHWIQLKEKLEAEGIVIV